MARRSFPAASTVLLLLAGGAPLGLPGQAELRAAMAMSLVFFWSLFRPASMPAMAVFAIGLLGDLLGLAPIGAGTLTLLAVNGVAVRARRVLLRQGSLAMWLTFAATAGGVSALEWGLASLLYVRLLPPGPELFMAALSAGLYPLMALLLTRMNQTLAEPERA